MPTLKEMLENDFGASETKTASVKTDGAGDDAQIEKIALELGLFGETKVAEEEKKEEEEEKEEKTEGGEHKEAGSLTGLFASIFPDDAPASEKTAEEKVAEAEEARGMRAFSHFSDRFDARVEKIASAVLAGGSVHKDSQPTNHFPNNKPADAASAINTKSTSVQDDVKGKNDERTVGHFEQKHASAAVRKHLLLSQLEG